MTAPQPAAKSGTNGLLNSMKTKLGPLPLWVWIIGGTGLLLVLRMRANSKAAAAPTTTSTTGTVSDAQIPDFVNQVYTSNVPPIADPGHPSTAPNPLQNPTGPGTVGGDPGRTPTPVKAPATPANPANTPGTPQYALAHSPAANKNNLVAASIATAATQHGQTVDQYINTHLPAKF